MFRHYICLMKIEKAIQQNKPFQSPYQKLIVNMIYSYNWLNGLQSEFFAKHNLTVKQYNILRILRGASKPLTTAVIRSRMLDKMSDSSRIVDRLAIKNLVHKKPCASDLRKVDVDLTKEGKTLLKVIDSEINIWETQFSKLTPNEANQLSDLLDKMRK